jgi:hypothetical protein
MDLKHPLLGRAEIDEQPFAHLPHVDELSLQALFEAHSVALIRGSSPACRAI